jgi:hypothetical protein
MRWSLPGRHNTHVAVKGSQGGNPLSYPCPLTGHGVAKEPGTRVYPAEGILYIAKLLWGGLLSPSNKNDIFNRLVRQFHPIP